MTGPRNDAPPPGGDERQQPTTAEATTPRPVRVLLLAHGDREAAQILMALRQGGIPARHERVADRDAYIAALATHQWDVVIAEFPMPQFDGLDALRLARSAPLPPPVVLVCGPVGEDAAAGAIKAGALDCMTRRGLWRLPRTLEQALQLPAAHAAAGLASPGDAAEDHRAAAPTGAAMPAESASRRVFDQSPVAMAMLLPDYRIAKANQRFLDLTGYDRAEMIGRRATELGIVADDAQNQARRAELARTGKLEARELTFRHKDGTRLQVVMSTSTIEEDGVAYRLYSIVDVSEQRRVLEESRLIRQAIAAISQGVLISDAKRMTISVNDAFESLTGYTAHELLGRPCSILQGADTHPDTVAAIRRALDAGQAFNGEILNYRKDGSSFWNALSINPVRDDTGQVTHFVGIQRNITDHKADQNRLKLAAQVFAQSREGVTVTDARNEIVLVNEAFSVISGYDAADVMGRSPQAFASTRQGEALYREIRESLERTGSWQGETVGRRKDGSEYPEWLAITAIRDESGTVCNYVRTFSDLSDQHAASDRIAWLSHYDALTGLPNRSLLAERCQHDIDVAAREKKPVAMMVVGIDRFKNINDTLGDAVGDKLLRKFAARLARAVREQDTVARIGGDEFAVVLPGDDSDGAALLATRLATRLGRPFEVNDTTVSVTASIGIAICPSDGLEFDQLFKSAQVALHRMKEEGRGSYRFFSAEMLENTMQKIAMARALEHAIEKRQLRLHYQPFVDLQTGRVGGMEALLRWNHPELGAVSPAVFIPLAEQSRLIVELGYWVLGQACEDLRRWKAAGLDTPPVSVNLSPAQFRDPGLLQNIRSTLQQHRIAPEQICLELTEGAVMEDVPHSERLMHELKATGLRLSLDDFGTGYSSLSYLKLFPFDKVKIDQSFVRNLLTSNQDAVIAKVVISMAHGLGLRVIAEGVETEAQCAFMRANACDEIQGYFFSRPVPADAMQDLLREDRRLPAHLVREQRRASSLLLVDDDPAAIAALQRLVGDDGYRILTATSGPDALQQLAREPVDIIVANQRLQGMTGLALLRQARNMHPGPLRIVLATPADLPLVDEAIDEGAVYRCVTRPWDDEQLRDTLRDAFHHKDVAEENVRLDRKTRRANQQLASRNPQRPQVAQRMRHGPARSQRGMDAMQEALQAIPLPVITLDDQGRIAFANDMAEDLFSESGSLQARNIAEALPEIDALLALAPPGEGASAVIDDRTYHVLWRAMGETSSSSGRIVTLRPQAQTAE